MAWHQTGNQPLSEPMMAYFTDICLNELSLHIMNKYCLCLGHILFLWYIIFDIFNVCQSYGMKILNTMRLRQNGHHLPDDIFKCIFLNENVFVSIKISLKFVPKGPINDITALIQIMAWRCQGKKPLSEPIMVSLLTHICVTQPQWVDSLSTRFCICHMLVMELLSLLLSHPHAAVKSQI